MLTCILGVVCYFCAEYTTGSANQYNWYSEYSVVYFGILQYTVNLYSEYYSPFIQQQKNWLDVGIVLAINGSLAIT